MFKNRQSRWQSALPRPIAFVLSGGANLGAIQVGMLRALHHVDLYPDLVVGTSVGALNGAAIANHGLDNAVDLLAEIWHNLQREEIFSGGFLSQAMTLIRNRLYLYENAGLTKLIQRTLSVERFDELQMPLGIMATELVTRQGALFTRGQLQPALLASTALPGIYPPIEINGIRYIDGGVTATVPLGAAVQMGAKSIVVLEVGNTCAPTEAPRHIAELMSSVLFSALRQRVMVEAPQIAQTHPLLYLPRPCTVDIGLLDFKKSTELMLETEEMVTRFLATASIPSPGNMRGQPHFHALDSYLDPEALMSGNHP